MTRLPRRMATPMLGSGLPLIGVLAALAALTGTSTARAQAVDRSRAPVIPAAPPFVFPTVHRETLGNGLELVIVERHDLPLAAVRAVIPGSAFADLPGREGTFSVMRAALNTGTRSRPATALAERFAEMGSAVTDSLIVTTSANLDSSLSIMADLLEHPAFPAAALREVIAPRIARARAATTGLNFFASSVLTSVLYGSDHPFARLESEASLAAITRDDIVAMHARWVRPTKVKIVIVGDVSPSRARASVEREFGSWRPDAAVPEPRPPDPTAIRFTAPPTAIYLYDVPRTPSPRILIGSLTLPRNAPATPALEIMNAIYGGLSAGRMQRLMRDTLRLAYGAPSAFSWKPVPAPAMFYTTLSAVAPTRVGDAIRAVLEELRGIAGARPATADEFGFGKQNRMASIPLQLETHEAMARQLAELVQQGIPPESIGRVGAYAPVTLDAVADAARRYVDPAHTAIVVVGDVAQLEVPLRAAGIAPVYVVDAAGRRIR